MCNNCINFILYNAVIISHSMIHVLTISPIIDDDIDSPYDEFTMSVNVLTCQPEIWKVDYGTRFKNSLSYYINYFCATPSSDDYYNCNVGYYSNESSLTTSEDVIFLGGYPKRSHIFWEIKFVVLWHTCFAKQPCPGTKPFAKKNILAYVLYLFSSNISEEAGLIIIDFEVGEPFDSTSRLINVIILPVGLAVTVFMAGVVWLAVAIERREGRIQEEIRMQTIARKRDQKKNSKINASDILYETTPDPDDQLYITQPGKSSPVLLNVTRINVSDRRLPSDGDFGIKNLRKASTGEYLPNVPTGNISLVPISKPIQRNLNQISNIDEEHSPKKKRFQFMHNKKQSHDKKHAHEQRQVVPKRQNIWRGGNIFLRPLGKRVAEGGGSDNQYL